MGALLLLRAALDKKSLSHGHDKTQTLDMEGRREEIVRDCRGQLSDTASSMYQTICETELTTLQRAASFILLFFLARAARQSFLARLGLG